MAYQFSFATAALRQFLALLIFCATFSIGHARDLKPHQQGNLEEITARSQQSFPETDALILSELKTSSDPQYRLQLLTKHAQLLDLYQRADRLLTVAREGQTLALELKQASAQQFFTIMEANALYLHGKLYEALRLHQQLAPALLQADSITRYLGMLSLAHIHMGLNQNEVATREFNNIIDADGAPIELKTFATLYLADLQINIGLYAKSLDYHRKALEITPPSYRQLVLYSEMGIARSLNTLKKHEEALLKIDSVIKDFHQSGNLNAEAYALLLKGYFLTKLNQFARAEEPYLQSATIYEGLGNPERISNIYSHLTGNFTDLKKIDKAIFYGEKNLALALNSDALNLQWDAYATLADAEAAAGRYKPAHQYMLKAFKIFQQSSRQTLDSQTVLIREQFDTERKEKENIILAEKLAIESLLLSNKNREIWILGTLSGAMAITLVTLLFAYRRTRYLAQHDGLTGLLNRRQIIGQGEQEFRRAQRYHTPLAIVGFDIDHFKQINDQYGHAEGDKVLKCVGQVCNDMVRDSDYVGRLGGEEFLIILPHCEKDGALKFAERVREKITQTAKQKITNEMITASFGVVELSPNDTNFESLLQRADVAMYHAKARGRNQCSTVDLQIVATA